MLVKGIQKGRGAWILADEPLKLLQQSKEKNLLPCVKKEKSADVWKGELAGPAGGRDVAQEVQLVTWVTRKFLAN